jgi:Fe2+ transport system protein FeoA
MSPLALLNEGEMAEIVAHYAGSGQTRTSGHTHYHEHGRRRCGGNCANCQCRSKDHGGASVRSSEHIESIGLRPGKKVEMITNSGTGPLVLRVDECRIAMGRGVAMKIYVRRIEG